MEHRLIPYIDTKAKCRHLKICKRPLRQVFICLSYTPTPLHTVYVHVLLHTWYGEGGELNQRKGGGATDHKAGLKIPT